MKQRLHILPTVNFSRCMGCGKLRKECEKELITNKDKVWKASANNCVKYGKQR